MPTLNTAQTATVSLTVPNAYMTVDCSSGAVVDVAWVSAGSISGRRTVQNISEEVGPFADQTTVTLYCRAGTASYSASGDQPSWSPATSGTWRFAPLGAVARFSASGGAAGGTWTLSYRNAAGTVTADPAETIAAGVTDVSPIFLDDATEIMVSITGTATVEMK